MITTQSNHTNDPHVHSFHQEVLFWATVAVSGILSLVATMGNGMVIFIRQQAQKSGSLIHLNVVIKSLAITDFLVGAVGMPVIIILSYLG